MLYKMRCGAGFRALCLWFNGVDGRNMMARLFFVIPFVLMVSVASAQQRADPGCARDVTRHCRSVMNDGDMAVLACLKQNRAKLSKTCEKVLTDHGQ
jgi:hypothetical protein